MKLVMVRKVSSLLHRRRQGSAALLTTVAISAILVVLFVGITTIATREISQSISSDNANRALYGAEAGVEDAVRTLAKNPGYRQNTCNEDRDNTSNSGKEVKVTSATGGPDVAWTCRTVTTVTAELTGRLQKDESLQLNLALGRSGTADTDPFVRANYMTIEWNDPKVDASQAWQSAATSFLPPYTGSTPSTWNSRAAAMEISSTWMEAANAGPGKSKITNAWLNRSLGVFPVRTVLASPNCIGATADSCNYSDFSPWNQLGFPAAPLESIGGVDLSSGVTSKCNVNPSAEYNCVLPYNYTGGIPTTSNAYPLAKLTKTVINNGNTTVVLDDSAVYDATNMVLRIKPRYNAASYRIRFFRWDGSSMTPVYLPDGYATIDVTARSGNYFRRVVAKKQITPGAYDGVFDNAMFSGKNICKTMSVYRDFRGAPDYVQSGSSRVQNPSAGRNNGCDVDD